MLKKYGFILWLLPVTAAAQSCHWRNIDFATRQHQWLILSAPDAPFFPVSDIIITRNGWRVKPLHSKYRPVRVRALGSNRYRFSLRDRAFALDYPNSRSDPDFSKYQLFSRGGSYTVTLFYTSNCRHVAYAEIRHTLIHQGKKYDLKQKLLPVADLVRVG